MNNIIKVAYFQQNIVWENSRQNIEKINNVFHLIKDGTNLLILPEMFHAGFTMNPEKVSESMNGEIINWMKSSAKKHNITIIGSVIIFEDDNYRNRLIIAKPSGKIEFYDKRHLFGIGGENEKYTQGDDRLITEVNGCRILPLICYDLRFPVWSRYREDYDILIYIANWPESRREVWRTLLKARAIENQCYVIGVNRVGNDKQNSYTGDSMVIDAKGDIINNATKNSEELINVSIDLDKLSAFRKNFPAWKDADSFSIE